MPNVLFLFAALALANFCGSLVQQAAVPVGVPNAKRWQLPWMDAIVLPLGLAVLAGVLLSAWLGLLVLALSPLLPRVKAQLALKRQRAELSEQLPGVLEALSGGLRAGLSLPQALEAATEDLPEPSAGMAHRLLAGLRLGQAPEDLMLAEAQGYGTHALAADWRLLSTAVAIQRSSGGDLAAVLDQLTETLRERQRLQAQVDALTAQGRLSAWIVGLLPLALLLALQALDPELIAPLFQTTTGWVLLGLGALLEAAGVLLLRRIVDIGV